MPERRADRSRRLRTAIASWLAFAAGPLAAAPETEASARAVAARYFAAHNAHRLDDVMALYAENPGFTLSMGRGTVVGKAAVRNLELFDAMAGSVLHPFGASFEAHDNGWHMHLAGVLESSGIFRAMGLAIVRTQPIRSTIIIRDGRITAIVQPELIAACSRTMAHGLGGRAAEARSATSCCTMAGSTCAPQVLPKQSPPSTTGAPKPAGSRNRLMRRNALARTSRVDFIQVEADRKGAGQAMGFRWCTKNRRGFLAAVRDFRPPPPRQVIGRQRIVAGARSRCDALKALRFSMATPHRQTC
jgi:hypothetical protein